MSCDDESSAFAVHVVTSETDSQRVAVVALIRVKVFNVERPLVAGESGHVTEPRFDRSFGVFVAVNREDVVAVPEIGCSGIVRVVYHVSRVNHFIRPLVRTDAQVSAAVDSAAVRAVRRLVEGKIKVRHVSRSEFGIRERDFNGVRSRGLAFAEPAVVAFDPVDLALLDSCRVSEDLGHESAERVGRDRAARSEDEVQIVVRYALEVFVLLLDRSRHRVFNRRGSLTEGDDTGLGKSGVVFAACSEERAVCEPARISVIGGSGNSDEGDTEFGSLCDVVGRKSESRHGNLRHHVQFSVGNHDVAFYCRVNGVAVFDSRTVAGKSHCKVDCVRIVRVAFVDLHLETVAGPPAVAARYVSVGRNHTYVNVVVVISVVHLAGDVLAGRVVVADNVVDVSVLDVLSDRAPRLCADGSREIGSFVDPGHYHRLLRFGFFLTELQRRVARDDERSAFAVHVVASEADMDSVAVDTLIRVKAIDEERPFVAGESGHFTEPCFDNFEGVLVCIDQFDVRAVPEIGCSGIVGLVYRVSRGDHFSRPLVRADAQVSAAVDSAAVRAAYAFVKRKIEIRYVRRAGFGIREGYFNFFRTRGLSVAESAVVCAAFIPDVVDLILFDCCRVSEDLGQKRADSFGRDRSARSEDQVQIAVCDTREIFVQIVDFRDHRIGFSRGRFKYRAAREDDRSAFFVHVVISERERDLVAVAVCGVSVEPCA